jgi:hypothetical protein
MQGVQVLGDPSNIVEIDDAELLRVYQMSRQFLLGLERALLSRGVARQVFCSECRQRRIRVIASVQEKLLTKPDK